MCSRTVPLALAALLCVLVPSAADAKSKRYDAIIPVADPAFGAIACAVKGQIIEPGTLDRRKRFKPDSAAVAAAFKSYKSALRRKKPAKILLALQKYQAVAAYAAARLTSCEQALRPPPPKPPELPPGLPPGADEVSLSPVEGPVGRAAVETLLAKAGFGLSPRDAALLQVGAGEGIEGVVREFMAQRPEPDGMRAVAEDLLDLRVGSQTTQDPRGQRAALMHILAHTNNAYSERLALFLLGVWTVSGDVISDETFRGSFWDYYSKLRQFAEADGSLPDLAVQIARDPLMLIYLNNDQNTAENPNENFARELLELFTVGPQDADGNPNYTETRLDGSGDIAVAARMLTGWKVRLDYSVNKLVPEYVPARHAPGPHTMFAGTPYQFAGENDEELIRGIFSFHPQTRRFYAREILREYLTPHPPRELIEALGEVLAYYGYRVRPTLAVLFKSKAFHHPVYRHTVPRNSIEWAATVMRSLALEGAFNVPEAGRATVAMGMPFNNAPSVFWFNQSAWTGPSVLLERANFIAQLLGDRGSQQARAPAWAPALVLPAGPATPDETIDHVARSAGCGVLAEDVRAQLRGYLNTIVEWNGVQRPVPYDNTNVEHQRAKGLGLYYILHMMPCSQLK